jgi:hypothetical protein
MVSTDEVIELARKNGFDYVIIFSNKDGVIKLAMGLNGLTEKINNVIASYLQLLHYFNIPYKVEFYNVVTKQAIEFMDIPMFFSIDDNTSVVTRQGGYM